MTILSVSAVIQSQEEQFQQELRQHCNAMALSGMPLNGRLTRILLQDIAYESKCRILAFFATTQLEGWEEITPSIQRMCQRLAAFAQDYYKKASLQPLDMQLLSSPVAAYSQGYKSVDYPHYAALSDDDIKSMRGVDRAFHPRYTD